jgi:hypothetical protein
LNQYPLKIIAASPASVPALTGVDEKPGTIVKADKNNGCFVRCGMGEFINLDILYCNDSFITGIQFVMLGIAPGMQFEKLLETQVA